MAIEGLFGTTSSAQTTEESQNSNGSYGKEDDEKGKEMKNSCSLQLHSPFHPSKVLNCVRRIASSKENLKIVTLTFEFCHLLRNSNARLLFMTVLILENVVNVA